MISRDSIDRILQEARIDEVVADFVTLKKSGSTFRGLSPWNQEKTPSFYVVPSKGIFKDFSSGKGGNAVTFLMELESMTYPEALRYLANKYGIEIEETGEDLPSGEEVSLRESLALVNHYAQAYFAKNLWEADEGRQIGLSYFRERAFNDATIKTFGLGYAIDENDAFLKAAGEAGHKEAHLIRLGLVKEGNYGLYDFFRGRVIFPIRNVSGRTIAFAGRTLKSDNKLKYLNSPESELYEKSKTLYGLYEGKRAIIQKDLCLLVEGYTDVISLHQAGVDYAVASSGTSLTEDQVKLIKRYTKNVSVLYDGDNAGVKAAMRGIDLLLEQGLQVKVVLFPEGHDPDSFARAVPQDELERYLKDESKDFLEFFTQVLLPGSDAKDPIKKTAALRRMVESLSLITDAISRSVFVEKCGEMLSIAPQVIHSEVNKLLRQRNRKDAIDRERNYTAPAAYPVLPELPGAARIPESPVAEPPVYEREILRVLLQYGNRMITLEIEPEAPPDEDEKTASDEPKQEENTIEVALAEYVLHELSSDEISLDTNEFGLVIRAFQQKFEQDGSFPGIDDFLKDPEMDTVVAGLIASPYELSENWAAKHRIFTENEDHDLKRLVDDPLMRIRLNRVMAMIHELESKLQAANTEEDLLLLLKEKVRLNNLKSQLSNYFGSTIL